MPDCIVVMGAAVRSDGTPSGAMQRRIDGALSLADELEDPVFLVTGGKGSGGQSEAAVMANALTQRNIDSSGILVEDQAADTRSSIRLCASILRAHPVDTIYVATDTYHIPRCRRLFRSEGIEIEDAGVRSGQPENGWLKWGWYYVREGLANLRDIAGLQAG